jgi:hypothetical protein
MSNYSFSLNREQTVRHEIEYRDSTGQHTAVVTHETPTDKLTAKNWFQKTHPWAEVVSIKAV